MMNVEAYIESLRRQKKVVYFMGERVDNVVDHPAMRPHIHSAAVTYQLAHDPQHEHLAVATSHLTGRKINRWTHIPQNQDDLVKKAMMLRVAGQMTGTCFQRCVGMDGLITLYTITWEMDRKLGTTYHERFKKFLIETQDRDYMTDGAMTDPKGDRSKRPSEQHDPDLYLRVVERREDGIVVRGAKMHQTGAVNSHQILCMPGMAMSPAEADYALSFAVPGDEEGLVYIFGRQVNDSRKWEGTIDQGNAKYGVVGGEALIIFNDVFVPWERVFMCGETEFTGPLVDRFASYHRQNYGACKSGNLDVLIGASASVAEMHGISKASHVRDKLAEMAHMVETMYSGALACSYNCSTMACGVAFVDPLLANVSKANTARYYPEVTRLAQDLAGGFVATLPSENEWDNPEVSGYIRKYYSTGEHADPLDRFKMGRLIENMTGATPIIECMHGAGSPQAQKVVVQRSIHWKEKMGLAEKIIHPD
ncbi:4-hydroxybutyryl-CoA dehydratase [Paenibacillus sp. MZ04-78.2]|uniref:4-hydroxyphenylacetate 3-hydroxylase family protein n=1 Tax=Paenibacillus sp. MZ04-78.2 TaxID=2962034 RepID=UPI0020B87276|nr:4-hydroxyphenylacetate 3-hydroxylase N-terminal domain-containing protein [Paenibacillus sp. MZ04-78.2]MCP3775756.1 4-hydroxybutyryl-CoA dehydratase [Paenibacillus sp. MZ04-78.2]